MKFPFAARLMWDGIGPTTVMVIDETPAMYRIEAIKPTPLPRGRKIARGVRTLVPKATISPLGNETEPVREEPITWQPADGPGDAVSTFVEGYELLAWTMRIAGTAEHGFQIWGGHNHMTCMFNADSMPSRESAQETAIALARMSRDEWPTYKLPGTGERLT